MRKRLLCLLLVMTFLLAACQEDDARKQQRQDDGTNHTDVSTDEAAYKSIAAKSNRLGFDLMDHLDEQEENVFLSPISVYMALSILYPGADGETQTEMAELLSVEEMSVDAFKSGHAALFKKIREHDEEDAALQLANSLWLDEQYELATDYEQMITADFQAEVANLDLSDDASADVMNAWVSDQTEDAIDQVVEAPLDDNLVAMLINAVYFNGKWTYPFDAALTEEAIFYKQDGEEITAAFMNVSEDFQHVTASAYEGVRLPYGKEGKLSMYAYLPTEPSDITTVHETLREKGVPELTAEMQESAGMISLPKFELEYEQEMNEVLQKLGMEKAFQEGQAKFPNIIHSNNPLHVSQVKHQTYLDVNEAGTEAAGATNVGIVTTSAPIEEPFELVFNQPFVMLIIDEATESILFMGHIYDLS